MMSSEEGYESTGFKMQTREILEKDAGTAIFQSPSEQKQIKKELLDLEYNYQLELTKKLDGVY